MNTVFQLGLDAINMCAQITLNLLIHNFCQIHNDKTLTIMKAIKVGYFKLIYDLTIIAAYKTINVPIIVLYA